MSKKSKQQNHEYAESVAKAKTVIAQANAELKKWGQTEPFKDRGGAEAPSNTKEFMGELFFAPKYQLCSVSAIYEPKGQQMPWQGNVRILLSFEETHTGLTAKRNFAVEQVRVVPSPTTTAAMAVEAIKFIVEKRHDSLIQSLEAKMPFAYVSAVRFKANEIIDFVKIKRKAGSGVRHSVTVSLPTRNEQYGETGSNLYGIGIFKNEAMMAFSVNGNGDIKRLVPVLPPRELRKNAKYELGTTPTYLTHMDAFAAEIEKEKVLFETENNIKRAEKLPVRVQLLYVEGKDPFDMEQSKRRIVFESPKDSSTITSYVRELKKDGTGRKMPVSDLNGSGYLFPNVYKALYRDFFYEKEAKALVQKAMGILPTLSYSKRFVLWILFRMTLEIADSSTFTMSRIWDYISDSEYEIPTIKKDCLRDDLYDLSMEIGGKGKNSGVRFLYSRSVSGQYGHFNVYGLDLDLLNGGIELGTPPTLTLEELSSPKQIAPLKNPELALETLLPTATGRKARWDAIMAMDNFLKFGYAAKTASIMRTEGGKAFLSRLTKSEWEYLSLAHEDKTGWKKIISDENKRRTKL